MASTMTAQIALLALALCLGSLACSADLAFTPNSLVLLGRAPCVSQLKDYDTISFGHSTVLNAFQLSKNPIIRGWPFPLGAYGKEPRGIPIALRAKIKGASDTPSETPVTAPPVFVLLTTRVFGCFSTALGVTICCNRDQMCKVLPRAPAFARQERNEPVSIIEHAGPPNTCPCLSLHSDA
jgi:hypothetical protein